MSHRSSMIASEVRRIIAPVLRECPRECGIVTMTRVEVSSDASYATVWISSLTRPEAALAFLESRRSSLQRLLGNLPNRKIPLLRFKFDKTSEEGSRLDKLLNDEPA